VGGVFVGGECVWQGEKFTKVHGKKSLAGALRVAK
jgi:hypothetical protein